MEYNYSSRSLPFVKLLENELQRTEKEADSVDRQACMIPSGNERSRYRYLSYKESTNALFSPIP